MTKHNHKLKGDAFENRYRLTGILTTKSPLHLGSGGVTTRPDLQNKGKEVQISAMATDFAQRAYIPGASLKGAIRGFLLNVFSALPKTCLAYEDDYEKKTKELKTQKERIIFVRNCATFLDVLFGTPFAEGKIEIWDCPAPPQKNMTLFKGLSKDRPPYWDTDRLTYVDQSVAIDPVTHTALDDKLYHFEVVPPGIAFEVNITGQNLSKPDLGLLLFGLQAFDSEIWPLTLGGMSGRGYGRFTFILGKVYWLDNGGRLKDWVTQAVTKSHAGYFSLKELAEEDRKKLLEDVQKVFRQGLEANK